MREVLLLSLIVLSVVARMVPDNPTWNKTPGEPGMKIRLTKKGANHVKTVAVQLLNEQIARMGGYSSDFPFTQPGLEGTIHLKNIRVLGYQPPKLSVINFLPPRYIVLGLESMDLTIASEFSGNAGIWQVAGSMAGNLQGMTIAVTTEFSTAHDGSLSASVSNCSTVIQSSHFAITPTGPFAPFMKTMEARVNDNIRSRIPSLLCTRLKRLVDQHSPRLFHRMAKVSLEDAISVDKDGGEVVKSFLSSFARGLLVDNRNVADPLITWDYIETRMKGEVRYNDSVGSVPFYPTAMNPPPSSDRMMYIYASDYMFNSLLYHAYRKDKLDIKLTPLSLPPRFRPLVSTSCERGLLASYCVGKLIPQLAQRYPNTTTSFHLMPHRMPDFTFNGDAGAVQLDTRIITYVDVNGRPRQVLVSSAEGQADIRISAQNERISADMTLNRLDVRLHRSSLPTVGPEQIERLTPLAVNFIAPQLAAAMKKGRPVPLKDSLRLLSPQMTVLDGFIELSTDFEINENALRHQIADVFRDIQL